MRSSLVTLSAIALACASAPPAPRQPFTSVSRTADAPTVSGDPQPGGAAPGKAAAEAPAEAPAPVFKDPRSFAGQYKSPDRCEAAARSLQASSRDRAWAVLRACVEKGGFVLIRRLLDGAWDRDLQTRADAGMVLTRVVAARGGDVSGDLNMLRQRRVPIFSLGPAAGHPDIYRGRLVMARVRVDDVKTDRNRTTVRLAEIALGGQVKYVEGSSRWKSSTTREGQGEAKWNSSRYGSGSASGNYNAKSASYSTTESRLTENVATETGLEALGRLSAQDPFFEPGRQFVVLARFDGMREVPGEDVGEDAQKLPVLSVIGYAEPSAAIVE